MTPKLMLVASTVAVVTFGFFTTANAQSVLPKYWEKCVVMVEKEVKDEDGTIDTVPHGTGFLFYDSTLGALLVTNRHILTGKDFLFIRYNKAPIDPGTDAVHYHREPCQLIGKDSKPLWKGHPDSQIDVAAVKLGQPTMKVDTREVLYSRFKAFDSLEVGEDVYFFGFPLWVLGLEGGGDFPILRSGIVSYRSFELTRVGHAVIDSGMFLVDGFSFGGNSGSPIFTRAKRGTMARLVGIISGHVPKFTHKVVGKDSFFVKSTGDTVFLKARPDTVTLEQNTGLAIAICADRIRETLEQFRTSK